MEYVALIHHKAQAVTSRYPLCIYKLCSSRPAFILWFNNNVEILLQSAMAEKLLSLIGFDYCILFDVVPFPNRTTLSYSSDSLFRINSGEKLSELSFVPVLPSPLFVSGFVAEFFTKVFVTSCCFP